MHESVFINNIIDALHFCLSKSDVTVWNKLYKRELFDRIRFPDTETYEDLHIMHLLIEWAGGMAISKDILYNYMIRLDSLTNTITASANELGRIDFCITRYEYITKKYKSEMLEKLCRIYIFGTLIDVIDKLIIDERNICNKEQSDIYNKLSSIHNLIFTRYAYADCRFLESEKNAIDKLKYGIDRYIRYRQMHPLMHQQKARSSCIFC